MKKRVVVTLLLCAALLVVTGQLPAEAEAGETPIPSNVSSTSYIIVSDGGYATNYMTRESNFRVSANQKLTFHCTRPCYVCFGKICGEGRGPPFPADVAVSTNVSVGVQQCTSWDGGEPVDYCISAAPVAGADAGLTVYFFNRSGNE